MTLSVDADLVNKVRDIALRAGDAIMEIYNTDFAVDRKDDKSPVTEADQKAEKTIAGLKRAMSDARDEAVQELERLQALESEVLCKQAEQLSKLKQPLHPATLAE